MYRRRFMEPLLLRSSSSREPPGCLRPLWALTGASAGLPARPLGRTPPPRDKMPHGVATSRGDRGVCTL